MGAASCPTALRIWILQGMKAQLLTYYLSWAGRIGSRLYKNKTQMAEQELLFDRGTDERQSTLFMDRNPQ
jgi:hypothetical protein